MRVFLFLPILILLMPQSQNCQVQSENSSVEVITSKWSKYRQKVENPDNPVVRQTLSAGDAANRNFARTRRVNDPVGTPDPNADTIEGRSAAMDKNMQEARSPKNSFVDGFMYLAKIRNAGANAIEILFWEYEFKEKANPANVVSRQFLCGVNIKPKKTQELWAFSAHSPSNLVSVDSLDDKSGSLFDEKIVINRIEYADGTIWQRKDWKYADMKQSITHALETPWGQEMCRSL